VHGGRAGTAATFGGRTLVAKLEWQCASDRGGRTLVAELELEDNWNSATMYRDWGQRGMGYLATRPINQSHGQTTERYITETWR